MTVKIEGFLQECVEAFVKTLSPKKIYLFGSRARGDHNEHSDYDFFIIMDDSVKLNGDEAARARLALLGTSYESPVDILVDKESSFLKNSHNTDFVDYYVQKEGIIIYKKEE